MRNPNRNFPISDEIHKRLKAYAAFEGVAMGEAVGKLLDMAGFKIAPPGASYKEWLLNLLEVGKRYGDEAAERYLTENSYKG